MMWWSLSSPSASQLLRTEKCSTILNHLRWKGIPHTPTPKIAYRNFNIKTNVIAQRLIFGSELCYTVRGRCFMLSMNYEKCP